MIGQKFGRLTVISEPFKIGNFYHLKCRCDCGTVKDIYNSNVTRGMVKSCGCLNKEVCRARAKLKSPIFLGPGVKLQRTKEITIIADMGNNKNDHKKWLCECECGTQFVAFATNLRKPNHTTSCGCVLTAVRGQANRTHGVSNTVFYSTWQKMLNRCYNPADTSYSNYGGRGIFVCEEWHDPINFCTWAAKSGWAEGLQIDRRDNDREYSPDNCRFVTPLVNSHNKRLLCANNTTGYAGVSTYGDEGKFRARVASSLGPHLEKFRFTDPKEAAIVRDIHCIKHNIPLPLNFPELLQLGPL